MDENRKKILVKNLRYQADGIESGSLEVDSFEMNYGLHKRYTTTVTTIPSIEELKRRNATRAKAVE